MASSVRIPIFTAILAMAAFLIFADGALAKPFQVKSNNGSSLKANSIAQFDRPWAMTFLDKNRLLVTTKPGDLFLVNTEDGSKLKISGVPKPVVGGQGGLGDVVLHPDYKTNGLIYLSLVESNNNGKTRGAIVVSARLELSGSPRLVDTKKIWTQEPKMRPRGHFSHRIAFGPKNGPHSGKMFITSGDRQLQSPAQDWDKALGKIIRLNDDGTVPDDNPWQSKGDLARTFWTLGHRNLLGIAFDQAGKLWTHEMGPAHGDELNLIHKGENYGWPLVSWGNNYSGKRIPNPDTRSDLNPPEAYWVPSIAPSGLVIYSGSMFSNWKGDALIGGLASRALIRVDINGDKAKEAERFSWGKRIREVEQSADGSIWVLEDQKNGRLIQLRP